MITPAQRRKIGAQIGELERIDGRKLDKTERRQFIGTLIGTPDLGSSNDVTKDQASHVIEELSAAIREAMDRPPIDEEGSP